METNRRSECANCQVIWCWRACRALPGVRNGEAFCKACGCRLRCVVRGRAEVLLAKVGQPLRAAGADVVRQRRIEELAGRDIPFSVHRTAA